MKKQPSATLPPPTSQGQAPLPAKAKKPAATSRQTKHRPAASPAAAAQNQPAPAATSSTTTKSTTKTTKTVRVRKPAARRPRAAAPAPAAQQLPPVIPPPVITNIPALAPQASRWSRFVNWMSGRGNAAPAQAPVQPTAAAPATAASPIAALAPNAAAAIHAPAVGTTPAPAQSDWWKVWLLVILAVILTVGTIWFLHWQTPGSGTTIIRNKPVSIPATNAMSGSATAPKPAATPEPEKAPSAASTPTPAPQAPAAGAGQLASLVGIGNDNNNVVSIGQVSVTVGSFNGAAEMQRALNSLQLMTNSAVLGRLPAGCSNVVALNKLPPEMLSLREFTFPSAITLVPGQYLSIPVPQGWEVQSSFRSPGKVMGTRDSKACAPDQAGDSKETKKGREQGLYVIDGDWAEITLKYFRN